MEGVGARDPSTLATLRPEAARELRFKRTRPGPRPSGSHLMRLRRVSRMPESSREYQPGDPVNLIDWQAFARTDQLLVRLMRDEAPARVAITIDASETMQWPGTHLASATVPTKAEIAWRVGLHLASLHLRLGDHVELKFLPPGPLGAEQELLLRSVTDVAMLFERLEKAAFDLGSLPRTQLKAARGETAPTCAYWLGDVLGAADALGMLAKAKAQVLVHVLSSLELSTAWVKDKAAYFDESFGRREYQGLSLRAAGAYDAGLARWRQSLEARVKAAGGVYIGVSDVTRIVDYHAAVAMLPVLAARP